MRTSARVDIDDLRERAAAALTRRREEVDHRVHLIVGDKLAMRTATALLTTTLAHALAAPGSALCDAQEFLRRLAEWYLTVPTKTLS